MERRFQLIWKNKQIYVSQIDILQFSISPPPLFSSLSYYPIFPLSFSLPIALLSSFLLFSLSPLTFPIISFLSFSPCHHFPFPPHPVSLLCYSILSFLSPSLAVSSPPFSILSFPPSLPNSHTSMINSQALNTSLLAMLTLLMLLLVMLVMAMVVVVVVVVLH